MASQSDPEGLAADLAFGDIRASFVTRPDDLSAADTAAEHNRPRAPILSTSQAMHFLEQWKDSLAESLQRYDGQLIERSKPCLKSKLLDQVRIVCVNNPKKRMFKGRMILAKNVVDPILRQERRGVALRERDELLCILQMVDGTRFDSVAAINSVKSHDLLLR